MTTVNTPSSPDIFQMAWLSPAEAIEWQLSNPGLNIAMANKNNEEIIYITGVPGDETYNDLTVTIRNNTGQTLTLPGGEPIPRRQPQGPACFYFTLNNLLPNEDIRRISLAPESESCWALGHFNQGPMAYFAVSLKAPETQLENHQTLQFKLTKIATARQPAIGAMVWFCHQRVIGVNDTKQITPFSLFEKPDQDRELRDFTPEFSPRKIIISEAREIPNRPKLTLHNTSSNPIVPEGTPWGENDPYFRLKFLTDSDREMPRALTTDREAAQFVLRPNEIGWRVDRFRIAEDPYWDLKPKRGENCEILGGNEKATFQWGTEGNNGIVTRFVEGNTPVYLYYRHIPGYKDGYLVRVLRKIKATPTIVHFDNQNSPARAGVPVKLVWDCYGGKRCSLVVDGIRVGTDFKLTDSYEFVHQKKITECSLTCHSTSDRKSTEKTKEITITVETPKIDKFEIENDNLSWWESEHFQWSANYASEYEITWGDGKIGGLKHEGNLKQFAWYKERSYKFSCRNEYESIDSEPIKVQRELEPVQNLTIYFSCQGGISSWSPLGGFEEVTKPKPEEKVSDMTLYKNEMFWISRRQNRTLIYTMDGSGCARNIYTLNKQVISLSSYPPGWFESLTLLYLPGEERQEMGLCVPHRLGDCLNVRIGEAQPIPKYSRLRHTPRLENIVLSYYFTENEIIIIGQTSKASCKNLDDFRKVSQSAMERLVRQQTTSATLHYSQSSQIVDLAVDGSRNRLYWIDAASQQLFISDLNGNGKKSLCPAFGNDDYSAMAIDPQSGDVVWIDSEGSGKQLCIYHWEANKKVKLVDINLPSLESGLIAVRS